MAKDAPYCSCPEDFELFPDTAEAVKLLNEHGFKVVVITNQSGVGRGYFTEETLAEIHEKMKRELAALQSEVNRMMAGAVPREEAKVSRLKLLTNALKSV